MNVYTRVTLNDTEYAFILIYVKVVWRSDWEMFNEKDSYNIKINYGQYFSKTYCL